MQLLSLCQPEKALRFFRYGVKKFEVEVVNSVFSLLFPFLSSQQVQNDPHQIRAAPIFPLLFLLSSFEKLLSTKSTEISHRSQRSPKPQSIKIQLNDINSFVYPSNSQKSTRLQRSFKTFKASYSWFPSEKLGKVLRFSFQNYKLKIYLDHIPVHHTTGLRCGDNETYTLRDKRGS